MNFDLLRSAFLSLDDVVAAPREATRAGTSFVLATCMTGAVVGIII